MKKFFQLLFWQSTDKSNIIYRILIHIFIIFLTLCWGYIILDIDLFNTLTKEILILYTYISFLCFLPTLLTIQKFGDNKGRVLFILYILFSYVVAFISVFILTYFIKKDLVWWFKINNFNNIDKEKPLNSEVFYFLIFIFQLMLNNFFL